MRHIALTLWLLLLLSSGACADSFTKLQLHLDGADASTSVPDSSAGVKTMTAHDGMEIDTAQSVFGGASGLFNGSTAYVSGFSDSDYNITNGLFTVDFRIRFNVVTICAIFQAGNGGTTDGAWGIVYGLGSLYAYYYTTDSSPTFTIVHSALWTPSTNTWYHIALVRGWGGNANDFAFTVDGVKVGSTGTNAATFTTPTAGLETVRVGCQYYTSANGSFVNGWIDEFRFSKGVARWTADFTPPTQAYADDAPAVVTSTRHPFII